MRFQPKALIAAGIVATAAAAALAATAQPEKETQAIAQAKTSLSQAITAAEARTSGKAIRAEFEQSRDGKWTFDVEVLAGGKVYDVAVDADSGAVLSVSEDQADHENEHDDKD
jgi:uncharacterized membrane protein YkoI